MIKTTKEYFEGHTSTAELVEQEEGGLMQTKNNQIQRLCLVVRLWCTRAKQAGITWEVEAVYKDELGWNYTEGECPAWVDVPLSW